MVFEFGCVDLAFGWVCWLVFLGLAVTRVVGFVVYGFWVEFWLTVNVLFGLCVAGFGVCLRVGCFLWILSCGLALVCRFVGFGCFGCLRLVVLCG